MYRIFLNVLLAAIQKSSLLILNTNTMETGMLITDIILLAIVIIPFLLIIRGTKKKDKKIYKALETVVKINNGVLTNSTVHNSFALGIDNADNKLYFVKNNLENINSQIINLNEMEFCRVETVTQSIKSNKTSYLVTDKLLLSFVQKNKAASINLELFNSALDTQLNGEVAVADSWKTKINQILQTNQQLENSHASGPVLA
ncbi:hypothetical protein [Lacinutrix chionoecetis]